MKLYRLEKLADGSDDRTTKYIFAENPDDVRAYVAVEERMNDYSCVVYAKEINDDLTEILDAETFVIDFSRDKEQLNSMFKKMESDFLKTNKIKISTFGNLLEDLFGELSNEKKKED